MPLITSGPRTPIAQEWKIVSFNRPLLWTRADDEVWLFNPPRRYLLNTAHLQSEALAPYIDQISDLKNSSYHVPLNAATQSLRGGRILVERYRDRGLGDLLFLTGPLSYLQHLSGGLAHIDLYGLVDRSSILVNHPALTYGGVMAGPVEYDHLRQYQAHWFIDTVTEHDETKDQLNVYDALYRQIGLDPDKVDVKFKRPSLNLTPDDYEGLDSLYHFIHRERGLDLRTTPYYVLAPSAVSSLRLAPYALWLQLAQELSKVRPVLFVGQVLGDHAMPDAGMSFGAFRAAAENLNPSRVINLMGTTSIRVVAALLARARLAVTLDSGLLYVAQAVNTPAVSLWGTHAPVMRIGYDRRYMDHAIHKKAHCPSSPCCAYAGFPYSRCVRRQGQTLCEPLLAIEASEVVSHVSEIEKS
jgi:ADP-heptose:LPS heptosyltransferase